MRSPTLLLSVLVIALFFDFTQSQEVSSIGEISSPMNVFPSPQGRNDLQATEVMGRFFLVPNENLAATGRLARRDYASRPTTVNGDKTGDLDSLSGMAFGR